MSVTASALREIHRIHRQITDLRSRLQRGPRLVKASEAHRQSMDEKFATDKESLQQTRMSADEKQLQLRQREERIKDLQGKLNSCATNREYQTLTEQIAADKQANNVLSDEILEALERIDEQQVIVTQEDEERQKVIADLKTLKTRVETEQTELTAELERVTNLLHEAESSLPSEIKVDYLRISRTRGEDTLAQVDGETCSGCFQMLSPQTMNILSMGRALFCSHCGALLYLPEDTTPGS